MRVKKVEEPRPASPESSMAVLAAQDLQALIDGLHEEGYAVFGPTVQQQTVVYDRIEHVDELPRDQVDEQDGGTYRLHHVAGSGYFAHVVGPQSWKQFLFPASRRLWHAERKPQGNGFDIYPEEVEVQKTAFLGVRACELAAIKILDRVFLEGPYVDPVYAERRRNLLIVAVNCSRAAKTCFCTSMETGPRVDAGFDLCLTELIDERRHDFLVEATGETGTKVLDTLPCRASKQDDVEAAAEVVARAESSVEKKLDTRNIHQLLLTHLDHHRWTEVADRCLACANCTLVCPTCFCSTVKDVTDLTGDHSERWQKWDSCFTLEHSYIHGGSVRTSRKARYRQWLTHKVASWIDQFGTSGCVGCGRCITWCPVGIDLTEEVQAIRET